MPKARFDHHLPPPGSADDRAVWYAATSLIGAVAESFGDLGILDRGAETRVVVARVVEPFELVDLLGTGARAFGLDQQIATTTESARSQAWAQAIYAAFPNRHGLRWRGRQSGSICVLLDDRAVMDGLTPIADRALADATVWPRIARAARRCRLIIVG